MFDAFGQFLITANAAKKWNIIQPSGHTESYYVPSISLSVSLYNDVEFSFIFRVPRKRFHRRLIVKCLSCSSFFVWQIFSIEISVKKSSQSVWILSQQFIVK